jgi:hypothetical protein
MLLSVPTWDEQTLRTAALSVNMSSFKLQYMNNISKGTADVILASCHPSRVAMDNWNNINNSKY